MRMGEDGGQGWDDGRVRVWERRGEGVCGEGGM